MWKRWSRERERGGDRERETEREREREGITDDTEGGGEERRQRVSE